MKPARLIVLGVAIAAGGLAALLAGRSEPPPAPAPAPIVQMDTTDVLVAKTDIGIGQLVSPNDIQWQAWPRTTANPGFMLKNERPNAIEQVSGSIARAPFLSGEPIRENKLIKANGSGFMAAILTSGMRAISTEITPETGAGGFILPNDHVDVILTRREQDKNASDTHSSETILTNVRVLAIDQTVEEKSGMRVVVGKTATLELGPRQAETLAVSRQLGTMSLALRSLADAEAPEGAAPDDDNNRRNARRSTVSIVRFGVSTPTTPK